MNKCKTVESFMKSKLTTIMMLANESQTTHIDIIKGYEAAVECLMYVMTMIRSDLAYALSMINKYCHNPDSTHVVVVQRIFRYIQRTLDYELCYELDQKKFHEYNDADGSEVVDGRQSIDAYIYFIAENAVSGSSKRQDVVIIFSCEFEYYVFIETDKKTIGLRRLLTKTDHINAEPNLIGANNQNAIVVVENSEFHRRMKHVDIKYHGVKKAINDELIQIEYVLTAMMIADDLIKSLGPMEFNRFLALIGMAY